MPDTSAPATVPSAGPRSVYPLPEPEDDPRFTFRLIFDIADVLTSHGYPSPDDTDWPRLMTALVGFLYQPDQETPLR